MEKNSSRERLEPEEEMSEPIDKDSIPSGEDSLLTAQARISVAIPRDVYNKFKLLALDREMTVSALLLHLIKTELQ